MKHDHSHVDITLGKDVYERVCSACHDNGVAGAIKITDKETWRTHIHHGVDHMVESVIKGKGAMPPRGGDPKLSDKEIESVVHYIIQQTQLYDKVVIFPPPEGSNVPKLHRSIQFSNEMTLLLIDLAICDRPYSICCDGNILVLPNMIRKRLPIPEYILNLPSDKQMDPQWLTIENGDVL